MSNADKELYEFADFQLDVSERLLLKKGKRVQLTNKAFEIMCLLVQQNNHLVGKDELLERVWRGAFVEENSLDKNISNLRQVLGERKGKQKFIETVHGRGYRFVAEVKRVAVEDSAKAAAEENIKLASSTPIPQPIELNKQDDHLRHEFVGNVVALADWRREINEANQTSGAPPEINPPLEVEQSVNVEADNHNPTESHKSEQALAAKPEIARSQSKKSRVPVRVLAGLLLIAAFSGIIYLLSLSLTPSPMKFQAGNPTRLTASGKVKLAAVSPDGKLVAYVQEESEEEQSLWLKHIATESNVNITPTPKTKFNGLTFSPDNNRIYYIANNGLYQMPVLGGMPRKVLDKISAGQFNGGISFSPDRKQFAFLRQVKLSDTTTERSIVIADADGTNEQTLLARQGAASLPFLRGTPAWSPDGKTIIASVFESGVFNILAVNVADKSAVNVLPNGWSAIRHGVWLPDSKSFLAIGLFNENELKFRQIWQISYPGGEARRVSNDFNTYTTVSLTADARFLAATRTEQVAHIWTMPSDDASHLKQITSGFEKLDGVGGLAWTPYGKIMYESYLGGKPIVSVMNADGSSSTQLISAVITSALSPDGRFLVYQRGTSRTGDVGLYRLDLSEMSEMRLTNGVDVHTTFSPDGKYVVFKRFGNDQKEAILRISIDGGEPTLIADSASLNYPAISPDGKTVALGNLSTRNLVLIPFEGGEAVKKFDVKFSRFAEGVCCRVTFQWTADGREVYYLALKDNVSNIWRQPIDGSPPIQITDFKDGLIFNFAFSPDGKQLALSRGTLNSDVVLIENAR